MKKLLITAATVSALCASSAIATQGEWYGTLYGGANKLNKISHMSSDTTGHISVGVGHYINEMFRADLTFDHLFDPDFNGTSTETLNGVDLSSVKRSVAGEVNALMINAYADLCDMGMAKFYVGAGVGSARVKAQESGASNVNGPTLASSYVKDSNEFAYAIHAGVATELSQGVQGYIMYSWKDYGKASKMKTDIHNAAPGDVTLSRSSSFKGHHGSIGVRVDF